MTREEAQFILSAYRPSGEDAHDPQFQPALALVREDVVLAQWFAAEQALDQAFAAKIRSRPISVELKSQLLHARTTGVCTPRWRKPAWLAAAACAALLLAVGVSMGLHRSRVAQFGQYRSAMEAAAHDMSHHADVMGLDAAGFQRWLSDHQGETNFVLPAGLAGEAITACKIIDWRERRVTMLCFMSASRHVDLFVLDESDLPGLELKGAPEYFADGGNATAVWQQGEKIYLLTGAKSSAELRRLL